MKSKSFSLLTWFSFVSLAILLIIFVNKDIVPVFLQKNIVSFNQENALVWLFVTTNINMMIILILSFFALRSFIVLVVDKQHEVFGSSLRVKLIVSFMFFSLVPTVVLIYLALRFINYDHPYREVFFLLLFSLLLLIFFFATWVGFTIANELTFPLQVILSATEQVAAGNYYAKVDDVVSDDEIGRLALSFRAMMSDLCDAQRNAERATHEARKKADLLFQKSQYNEVLLRNTQSCVISFGEDEIIKTWNEQAEFLFSVSEQNALGKEVRSVIGADVYCDGVAHLIRQLRSSQRACGEFVGRVGPHEVQLQVSAISLSNILGKPDIVVFIHDLTEVARAQRLAAWRDVARRIAHEIKNPLTPIQLGVQRLQRKFLDRFEEQDQRVFLNTTNIMLNSVETIRSLVDEFVRFARMPASVLRLGNIVENIRMVVDSFSDNIEKVSIRLEVCEADTCDTFPVPIHGQVMPHIGAYFDEIQFARLLSNLMTNAISASADERGTVVVRVSANKSSRSVQVSVIDAGVGIPVEHREKIFEPYFSTKRTGTGLGLVIVKQIAHEHRGILRYFENRPKGSVFAIEMPLAMGEDGSRARALEQWGAQV